MEINPARKMDSQESRDLKPYSCIFCRNGNLEFKNATEVLCSGCKTLFPIQSGVMDTLIKPDLESVRELQGMAREMGLPIEKWESVKLCNIERRTSIEERLHKTAQDPNSYYHQTLECFEQAFQLIKNQPVSRVLEVGADDDFCYLEKFRKVGAHCYAANLRFHIPRGEPDIKWPESTLGDMNALPYANESMDVVLLSATSHHSPDLEKTVAEVSRILKPGGVALFLNDQISGIFKIIKDQGHWHRDNYIHENYYSIGRYHSAFIKSGFRPQYLFSAYYDRKLKEATVHSASRFALIGRLISKPWQYRAFRHAAKKYLLWPAHFLFGFPLNVILWKEDDS